MFLADDLLLSPFTSLLWVFKEINEAVQQEKAGEAEGVTRSLSELYMKLETGAITEEQFAAEEKQLLDRLDAIELRNDGGDAESDDGPDEEAVDESDEDEIELDDGKVASSDEPQAPRVSKRRK
ncbi:MAG: gas vesicle protein GvpG [Betaproteobacteria bacterium]|nr:gas vesicle protein GvpG [Betaproteobacteria bacterium]